MAATVCPAPQFVGLDNSGNPLSGGKLYSYSAGTTSALDTFSDSDLSVANANPIILDAGGRATVYLSASSYKFKLTSSGDDVIYTQDDIIAPAPYDVDLDVPFVAGEAVTAGQAIYLSDGTGSRTEGRWYLTDSDTAAYSTLPITGFAVAAVALAATGSVRLLGRASVPGTLSVGSTYYLGATPGALASSAGTFSKAMGVADTASTLVMTVQQTISQVANLLVTGTLRVNGVATFDVQPILTSLTASQAVFSDGSKGLVSNAITGTGNVVMSASPTMTGTIGAAALTLSTPLAVPQGGTGVATLTSGDVLIGAGTSDVTSTANISVAQGGTGVATLTLNSLLIGAGTSDVTFIGPGASGQILASNGTLWASTAPSAALQDIKIYTGNATWTKPAGLSSVVITVLAGGGGGGGAATTDASQATSGGGGGGGGMAFKNVAEGDLGGTEAVTVGAAGAAAAAGASSGGTGGASSFGSHATATGGAGGDGANAGTPPRIYSGGAGGVGSSGDFDAKGAPGMYGLAVATGHGRGGYGGASYVGGGGISAESSAGGAGGDYGGGGAGGGNNASQTQVGGGAGAAGLIIVWEFA
jgi:hypothetical protein